MSKSTEAEIRAFIKKVATLYGEADVKKELNKASKPLTAAARINIPVAKKDIHRTTAAGVKTVYKPGNLRRSIRRLVKLGRRHRNLSNIGIHIGAVLAGRRASGVYGGNRVDGFYAHWFEDGAKTKSGRVRIKARHYWKNAVASTGPTIKKDVARRMILMIREKARKKGIN